MGCHTSKDPANLKKELSTAVVANSSSYLHRSQQRLEDDRPDHVSGEVGRFGPVGKLIGLASLDHAKEIDGTPQQRRKFLQLSDIPSLKKEVLIGQQFVGTIRGK